MREVDVLRFRDMAFGRGRQGTLARRIVHLILSLALRLFFRRIETGDAWRVPPDEPLIFVSNHPNGLIDPALIFCSLPRRISFLAKSTLFRIPVVKFLITAVDSLPLYRRVDTDGDLQQNKITFEKCHALLRRNRCIALFPEGVSHNSTRLLPIKTGAARIALGALSIGQDGESGESPAALKIVPVGLYYTSKTSFRSEALIRFGAPLEARPVQLDEFGEPPREAVRELSNQIETALLKITLNVGDDAELEVVTKAQQLFSSLYAGLSLHRQTLATEFDLRRRLAETLADDAPLANTRRAALRDRILRHEEELGALGIEAENLSLLTHTRWTVFRHFLLRGALLLALLPFTIPGALVHLPAFLICELLARFYRRHGVDEIAPTVKILAAIGLMPLTWLVVAALCYLRWDWRIALLSMPAVIACGYAAMRSLETLSDMGGWFKGVLLLVNQRRRVLRLFLERRALHSEMVRFLNAESP